MLSQLAIPVCSFSPKSAYMKTPVAPRHCTTGEGNPLLCGRLLLGRASSGGVTEKRDVCACSREALVLYQKKKGAAHFCLNTTRSSCW